MTYTPNWRLRSWYPDAYSVEVQGEPGRVEIDDCGWRTAEMKHVSIFSGIGGGDLGFEQAGFECVFQVERNPKCVKVLAFHWPATKRHLDIETLDASIVPEADCWIVSDPCQANTAANSRWKNGKQAKSLWNAAFKLIEQSRPTFVIRENPTHQRKDAPSRHEKVAADLEAIGYVPTIIDMQCGEVSGVSRQRTFVCAGIGPAGMRLRTVLAEHRCDKRNWPAHRSPALPLGALTCHPFRYESRDNYIAYPDGRVRVLSCGERLRAQGFPEDWVSAALGVASLNTVAKMTGNAWPVFAARWIADRVHGALLEARDVRRP